jgi:hypothetical protein
VQEDLIRDNVALWRTEVQLVALGGHYLVMDNGPEVADSESPGEEHGETVTTIWVS